ncbi:MAG: putative capsid protein of prophage [Gemmatimonadetes bacterium]|nr:putative capsid protein of prophage [Gemmatimonadota bacterium]
MDYYSTEYLMGVVGDLKTPPRFMLDRYFTTEVTSDTENIDFDVVDRKRRIAPLVSPLMPGKIMNQTGRTVKTLKPAYTKDKRIFDGTSTPFKRAVGEKIGGTYTPQQRLELAIAAELDDQINLLTRRQEFMAMETMRLGKLTLVGDGYPSTLVDFQRDAALTITLAGANRWSQANTHPLDNLLTWALLSKKKCGAFPTDVTMALDAFQTFIKHPDVSDRWKSLNAAQIGTQLVTGTEMSEASTYMGTIDGFKIFVYADWYVDENDVEQDMLPSGWLVMGHPAVEGVRCYGAIKDLKSLRAVPYFAKSWEDEDPSARYLMLQSAPLTAPTRPNASIGVSVL